MQTILVVSTTGPGDGGFTAGIAASLRRLVPTAGDPAMRWLARATEGPDDMTAHVDA